MNLAELKQKRADLIASARALLDKAERENRKLSGEDKSEYDSVIGKVRNLSDQIKKEEERREDERKNASQDRSLSDGIALRKDQKLSDVILTSEKDKRIARDFNIGKLVRGLALGNWEGAELERRAMSEGTSTLGGVMVPSPVASNVLDMARNKSVCIDLGAQTVPMKTSNLTIAKVNADPSVYWRGENTAITEDTNMELGPISLEAKTLGCLVRCSIELLEDAPNAGDVIEKAIAGALGSELDRVGLVGSGSGAEPTGIFNTSNVNEIDMGTDGGYIVGYAKLVEAAQKVLENNGAPNGFVYAPRTWADLENSLSGDGQFIEIPPGIKNMEYRVSNQIPIDQVHGGADNATTLFCGGWENLIFGMRTQLVLEASRVADSDTFSKMQVLVRGYLRADVGVARPGQFSMVTGIIPSA